MRRLFLVLVLVLAATQTGRASLETDCYFLGGYFGSTYYQSGYFDESCAAAGAGGHRLGDSKLRYDLKIGVN